MRTLYHYTCDHGRAAIGDRGRLVPAVELARSPDLVPWQGRLIWLTDLAVPIRSALGLTSHLTTCDRTAHRYRVTDAADAVPWMDVRRAVGDLADELELTPGARPRHWFVARRPVPVEYDPRR